MNIVLKGITKEGIGVELKIDSSPPLPGRRLGNGPNTPEDVWSIDIVPSLDNRPLQSHDV